jgi:Mg-chelatase subunit ChlD
MRSPSRLALVLALLCACGDAPQQSNSGAVNPEESDGNASGNDDDADDTPSGEDDDDTQVDEDGTPDDEPEVCETLNARADPQTPEVLIVLDRSGSMAGERWDRVIAAIDDLTAAFPEYHFGLAMYPSVGEELACKPGKLDVAPDQGTAQAIHDVLFDPAARAIQDQGYTPTSSTLRTAESFLSGILDNPRERYVLLVTDGQPNCNAAGPTNATDDLPATLTALTDLKEKGIATYVFGYLTEALATSMNQMAVAGGTGAHYAVEDEATILDAFASIEDALAPCTFALEESVQGVEFVRVKLDGEELSYDADGFSMADGRTVELGAASCAIMRDGASHSIEVVVECEPVRVL